MDLYVKPALRHPQTMELIPRAKHGSKRARSPFVTVVCVSGIVLGAFMLVGGAITLLPQAIVFGALLAAVGVAYLTATRPASETDRVRIRSWRLAMLLYFGLLLAVGLLGFLTAQLGT